MEEDLTRYRDSVTAEAHTDTTDGKNKSKDQKKRHENATRVRNSNEDKYAGHASDLTTLHEQLLDTRTRDADVEDLDEVLRDSDTLTVKAYHNTIKMNINIVK